LALCRHVHNLLLSLHSQVHYNIVWYLPSWFLSRNRNSRAVLKRFYPFTPDENRTLKNPATPDGTDWRKVRELIHASVKVGAEKQAQELIQIFDHLQVLNVMDYALGAQCCNLDEIQLFPFCIVG
jgi:hypothetical protein